MKRAVVASVAFVVLVGCGSAQKCPDPPPPVIVHQTGPAATTSTGAPAPTVPNQPAPGTFRIEVAAKLAHPLGRCIRRYEQQDRIVPAHQGDWAVEKLRAAEGLGVEVAGLLELQRGLPHHAECRASPDGR